MAQPSSERRNPDAARSSRQPARTTTPRPTATEMSRSRAHRENAPVGAAVTCARHGAPRAARGTCRAGLYRARRHVPAGAVSAVRSASRRHRALAARLPGLLRQEPLGDRSFWATSSCVRALQAGPVRRERHGSAPRELRFHRSAWQVGRGEAASIARAGAVAPRAPRSLSHRRAERLGPESPSMSASGLRQAEIASLRAVARASASIWLARCTSWKGAGRELEGSGSSRGPRTCRLGSRRNDERLTLDEVRLNERDCRDALWSPRPQPPAATRGCGDSFWCSHRNRISKQCRSTSCRSSTGA
jgi:hypothetical protein